jgi:hypothetical protein
VALIVGTVEPDGRTPVAADAGWAVSASVAAAKTARAGPAVTVLSLMGAPRVEADSRLAVGEQERAAGTRYRNAYIFISVYADRESPARYRLLFNSPAMRLRTGMVLAEADHGVERAEQTLVRRQVDSAKPPFRYPPGVP